jgi:succinate dehydrogenase/fumarate reductase flavoprotein subunit
MIDYDVAVVGTGAAGLCAALEASAAGASVLLIEGSEVIGGSTRLSSGVVMGAATRYQKAAGIEDTADDLFAFYMSTNHWKVEPPVVRALAENAGPTIEWLGDLGAPFWDQIYFSGDEPKARGHVVIGEGQAIVDTLHAEVRRRDNIEVAVGRRVNRLIVEGGRVLGIAVDDDRLRAGSVVLAMGGFGANPALLDTLIPEVRRLSGDFFWYIGAETSRGDAFALGELVDAQVLGHGRCQMNVRPDFAHLPDAYLPGWLMMVNAEGLRFFNEMSPYSVTQPIFLSQPHPIYAVFDDEAKRAAQPKSSFASKKVNIPGADWEDWVEPVIDEMLAKGKVIHADTIEELAEVIGVPAASLTGTIARYNADTAAGHDSMYLKEPSVMRPVANGPFYAVEVRLTQLGLTSVGLRIDPDGRVLSTASAPVPGLFAAGECTGGVLGDVYMGSGNSLANCLTFGRIAGRAAAAESAAGS